MSITQAQTLSERTVLGAFMLGHGANDWAAGAIWLIAPAMALAMDLGAEQVGLLITLYGFGAALAYLPAGLLADRTHKRGRLLVATFWWVAIGHVAASFAPDYWSFAALMAVAVMGDAAWHPIATGYLVQRFPNRRAHVLGLHAMGGTLGADVLAPLAVGAALAFADWRVALQLAAIPAALTGIVFLFVAPRLQPVAVHRRELDLADLLRPWTTPYAARLAVMMVLYNMASIALISMMPLYLQRELGFGAFDTAVMFAATLLAGSLAQPFVGKVSDRMGRRTPLVAGMCVATLAAFVAGSSLSVVPGVAGLFVAGATLTAVRSVVLASALDVTSGQESGTLALAFTVLDGVGALGAWFAGLAGAVVLANAFLLAAAFGLAATVLALGASKTGPA